ncbi:MAG: hypothetical protein LBK94_05270 [Prevotellaceae bacterium]|jgi:hypothetical protein|nr:hypothetical protein [Prevotellaceae bacterium]
MNYIELINQFWEKDVEYDFSANETALYFYLMSVCNRLSWKNPFGVSSAMIVVKFGWGRTAFDNAKNKLKQACLIDFKRGNGKGNVTEYSIIDGKGCVFKPPLQAPLQAPLQTDDKQKGCTINKLNKTKTFKKSFSDEKDEKSPPASETLFVPVQTELEKNFEAFRAWIEKNAPNVSRMKEPFTVEQYAKLIVDFDFEFIRKLLQNMHNWKDLNKKNVSANLTFRKWAKQQKDEQKTDYTSDLYKFD